MSKELKPKYILGELVISLDGKKLYTLPQNEDWADSIFVKTMRTGREETNNFPFK